MSSTCIQGERRNQSTNQPKTGRRVFRLPFLDLWLGYTYHTTRIRTVQPSHLLRVGGGGTRFLAQKILTSCVRHVGVHVETSMAMGFAILVCLQQSRVANFGAHQQMNKLRRILGHGSKG